jgi:hypothetical protein
MATTRMAAGSILGSVTDVANSISAVFNTVTDSVSMAHNYVKHQRSKQEETQLVDQINFRNRLVEDTAKENTKRQEEITNWLSNNEIRTQLYNKNHSQLLEAFAKYDASKSETKPS